MSANPLVAKAQACSDAMEILRQMIMTLSTAINAKLSPSVTLTAAQITALQSDYAALKTQLQAILANI
jgi:hypothetical protein